MFGCGSLCEKSARQQILMFGIVLTLANLAFIIHKSSRVFLFQQSQCLAYYMTNDPTKINSQHRIEEVLCKSDDIQSRLSVTDGIESFLSFLPGMPSLSPLPLSALQIYDKPSKIRYLVSSIVISKDQCANIRRCNDSTARSRDLQGFVARLRPTSLCDNQSLLFCFSCALFNTQLYEIGFYLDSTSIILNRHTVSLHRTWAANAILTLFVFDLIGGGETTRIIIMVTCIAVISPAEEL